MLRIALLTLAASGSLCLAQSPLVTLNQGGNSGNAGGTTYFDLTVHSQVNITQINFRVQTATGATGTLEVWMGPATYLGNYNTPSLWTKVDEAANVTLTTGATLSLGVLTNGICLDPGTYGISLHAVGFSHSYTNGNGTNQQFSTAEMTIDLGGASNYFHTNSPPNPMFFPRVWNGEIHYNTLPCTPIAVASADPIGEGCYDRAQSFYELWPNPINFDFGSVTNPQIPTPINSMTMNFAGALYSVSPGNAALYTPTSPDLAIATGTTLNVAGAANSILYIGPGGIPTTAVTVEMASCGVLTFDGALINPAGTAQVDEFLNGPATAGTRRIMNTGGTGASTHYDYDATLGAHIFTWLQCPTGATGTTNPNDFQILCYDGTGTGGILGDMEYRWGTMSQVGGGANPVVMGYSPGGGARDYGGDDMSERLAPGGVFGSFLTDPIDNQPLTLELSARPLLGTSPSWDTSGLEPGNTVGGLALNIIDIPGGLNLSGAPFFMPECTQYVSDTGWSVLLWVAPATSITLAIPNNPAFNGVVFYGQSFGLFSGFNGAFGLGVNASNGVRAVFGNL